MRIFTIQEDPLPEFEVDEKPEAVAMLSDACSMVFGQSSEASGFKESPLKRPRSQDKLLHNRPERSPEPPAHRNRKPHFPSPQDFSWHQITYCGSQDGFGLPAVDRKSTRLNSSH